MIIATPAYYICKVTATGGIFWLLWKVEGSTALRIGANIIKTSKSYCEARPGESILDSIREVLGCGKFVGPCEFYRTDLEPGQYYHRMSRPDDRDPTRSPGRNPGAFSERNFVATALGQLNVLVRQLNDICQTVHPSEASFGTYGHAIRNLLILASTEVEMHWRGILDANLGSLGANYRTNDYVLLRAAMRLDEYAVSFPTYPWLQPLSPFRGWEIEKPSASLEWFKAYNGAKHNREQEFDRATLQRAFEAVTACAIMMVAQFGASFDGWQSSDASRFFVFDQLPQWTPSEVYISPYELAINDAGTEAWTPVRHAFQT